MTATAYVYEAGRTPFGHYGGSLAGVRPDDLGAHVIGALPGRVPDLDLARSDDVLSGNADGAGEWPGGSEGAAERIGAEPLARVVPRAVHAVDPDLFGIGLATLCIGVGQGLAMVLEGHSWR